LALGVGIGRRRWRREGSRARDRSVRLRGAALIWMVSRRHSRPRLDVAKDAGVRQAERSGCDHHTARADDRIGGPRMCVELRMAGMVGASFIGVA